MISYYRTGEYKIYETEEYVICELNGGLYKRMAKIGCPIKRQKKFKADGKKWKCSAIRKLLINQPKEQMKMKMKMKMKTYHFPAGKLVVTPGRRCFEILHCCPCVSVSRTRDYVASALRMLRKHKN